MRTGLARNDFDSNGGPDGRHRIDRWRRVAQMGLVAGLFALVTGATGCGPVLSTYLILTAQAEIDGAEAAEAEEYAPYHYTAANEYIAKAREEQGYADFGPAVEYAWKAKDYAEEARLMADKAKKNLTPPEQRPATEIDVTPTAPVTPPPQNAPVIIRKNDGGGAQ